MSRPTPVEYIASVADALAAREKQRGVPCPDGPSADDLRALLPIFRATATRADDAWTAAELWQCLQDLAAVSDQWEDPESDPLGPAPREFLENAIAVFADMQKRCLPESGEALDRWLSYRAAAHAAVLRERQRTRVPTRRLA